MRVGKKIERFLCILPVICFGFGGLHVSALAGEVIVDTRKEEKLQGIPEKLIEFMNDYPQTMDYVLNYKEKKDLHFAMIDLSEEANAEEVPLLIQWDERWGYENYGTALIGYAGCGPTCLSMVALYLTRNAEYTPLYIAEIAEERGYYITDIGTSWELFTEGCQEFGLTAEGIPLSAQNIKDCLAQGRPLICSVLPGDFTKHGHFIVLTKYDEDGLHINDPNSPDNSSATWDLDQVLGQINAMWAFQKSE